MPFWPDRFHLETVRSGTAAVPFVGALDGFTTGLTVCWDLKRRLLSSYTGKAGLVRADRTGQPTYEIPFLANGAWDTAGLLSFAGSDSVYLVQAYAQIGSFAFEQATAAAQPRLVNAGVLDANGAVFDGTSKLLVTSSILPYDVISASIFQFYLRSYQGVSPSASQRILLYNVPGGGINIYNNLSGTTYFDSPDRISGASSGAVAGNVSDLSCERFGTAARVVTNNAVTFSGTVAANMSNNSIAMCLGDGFEGNISSCVIWNTGDTTLATARTTALL